MSNALAHYFDVYPQSKAPFMHKQLMEWGKIKPLHGIKVLHNLPVVPNTLLKIACLIAAGAEVTVTNPNFLLPSSEAITALKNANIEYVDDISRLRNQSFDIYFDCGAELYTTLGSPTKGAVEITASGDQYYRSQTLDFPVISIDSTLTKQLETVFGSAESASLAIAQLSGQNVADKVWLIFGFGKIGRGLAYYCMQNHVTCFVVDIDESARNAAHQLGLTVIDPANRFTLQSALSEADIVVTASAKANILADYPKSWFTGKTLANMGVLDEFGNQFAADEVLNNKLPVNFILNDPTPIEYIDPEFYVHNLAALYLDRDDIKSGVTDISLIDDDAIIKEWCRQHQVPPDNIQRWFLNRTKQN